MNGALRNSLTNPWLASLVSFLPIVAVLACLLICLPRPLPTTAGVGTMPSWPPLGGLVRAFAVIAGLLFVNKVGAGPFAGLTITANIPMSLVIDKFGWFGMDTHPLSVWRMLGAVLMVGGITLIAKFWRSRSVRKAYKHVGKADAQIRSALKNALHFNC